MYRLIQDQVIEQILLAYKNCFKILLRFLNNFNYYPAKINSKKLKLYFFHLLFQLFYFLIIYNLLMKILHYF